VRASTSFRLRCRAVSEPDTFRLDLAVAEEDIDVLGGASNIAFVRWIQEVAIALAAFDVPSRAEP